MAATATAPKTATRKKVWEVEIGFPRGLVMVTYDVEAETEAEAKEILCKWFRDGLRVLKG